MKNSNAASSPALLLIGSGDRLYRGYALKALADRYRVILIDAAEPTWQKPHLTGHRVADPADLEALRGAVQELAALHRIGGVLSWNEFAVVHTALIAESLGTPGLDPIAVRTCRFKPAARAVFDAHNVPSARWVPVYDFAHVRMAADHLGYPFVLKPASAAGSAGVIRVDSPDQLQSAYAFTAQAAARHGVDGAGLLAEEYLTGPEASIEVVSLNGRHHVAAVTHKQLSQPPYFEELSHIVAPELHSPDTDAAEEVAVQALEALDITHGVAHVEIRLTPVGPRIIEVNPRLGGDLIPHLVRLATGIDLVAAAADLAMGLLPDLRPTRAQAAAIGFVYPTTAGQLQTLTTDPSLPARPWCERAVLEQQPNALVAPPPASGLDSRLAHLIVTADTPALCRRRMDRALASVHADITAPDTEQTAAA
ncbi:ATP-grasp domain-containing protein [Streptomyces sp. BE147]|uniref:ATP-grasp domain-containing protein n=1 Tax=Streptomyces sp. BE147 TaxID=3002524 RepID=UPI002E78956F|nr:ATP-grasp domain-containing protein [Streptomyces sp. BE147]MEE1736437.1 ATP-grasp domain-containing protein [Streptomyces sp. BE147]